MNKLCHTDTRCFLNLIESGNQAIYLGRRRILGVFVKKQLDYFQSWSPS